MSAILVPSALRFWLKVYQVGDCWQWRSSRSRAGYGIFGWDSSEQTLAHRQAWELAHGRSIPAHLEIDHLCHHRWCVRPSHLDLVPHAVNVGARRQRRKLPYQLAVTHCPNGHPYAGDNLGHTRQGHRRCRNCDRNYYYAHRNKRSKVA